MQNFLAEFLQTNGTEIAGALSTYTSLGVCTLPAVKYGMIPGYIVACIIAWKFVRGSVVCFHAYYTVSAFGDNVISPVQHSSDLKVR